MNMKIHNLVQGTPEWDQFRLEHNGASEAAAMLGESPKVKRSELLHAKKTGIARTFSDWVREKILDPGHAMEAAARPIVEEIIGDDLYPVTCSRGKESASCDGLTLEATIAMEHKRWNAAHAAIVAAGQVPEEHMPQCQQVLMVTGAEKLIFVMSDGTRENMVHVWVYPDQEWFKRLRAGWAQFAEDLAAYVPTAPAVPVTAAPMESLPAVTVQLQGQLVVASNLPQFDAALRAFIERIPAKASTDQEFADTEAACKALKKAEEALDAADEHSLASLSDVAAARKLMADLRNLARTTRLAKEKDVAARKEQIRLEIVTEGRQALAAHHAALTQRLGKPYLPVIAEDFGGVIKGKKTVASLRDAVSTELARAKIAANEIADRIQANLTTLRERAADHAFLFADTVQLVLKQTDDLAAIVSSRIAEHEAKEAARLASERERIAAEEKAKAEEAAAADAKRQADEAAEKARVEERARIEQEQAAADAARAAEEAQRPVLAAAPTPAPAVVQMPVRAAAPAPAPMSPPTLKMGDINGRLHPHFKVTAEGLSAMGFEPAGKERSWPLYHERDWPHMLAAMANTIQALQAKAAA